MNARLYDPVLGRMLSPDNFVGDAGSQGFNRYSYANNNPLVYTDPSGNFLFVPFLVAAAVQGGISAAITIGINFLTDKPLFEGAGTSFLIGAAGGAVGNILGQVLSNGSKLLSIGQKIAINLASGAASLGVGAALGNKITWGSVLATVGAAVAGPYVERYINKIIARRQMKLNLGKRLDDIAEKLEGQLANREAIAATGGGRNLIPDHSVNGYRVYADEITDGILEDGRTWNGQNWVKNGEFSISDWDGYPAGNVPKPTGPFRLIEGAEYDAARALANRTNEALKVSGVFPRGYDVHEIIPVKFGGSPTDLSNKIALLRGQHSPYTTFWNRLRISLIKK